MEEAPDFLATLHVDCLAAEGVHLHDPRLRYLAALRAGLPSYHTHPPLSNRRMPQPWFPASTDWRAIGASVLAGILVAFLVRINATLGEHVGVLEATFIIHVVGTAFALLLVGVRLTPSFWGKLRRRPAYELSGGAIGVVMVLLANITVPPLGVALAVGLFVAADLFFASVSDHFGWLGLPRVPITRRRIVGLVLVLAGVVLLRWG